MGTDNLSTWSEFFGTIQGVNPVARSDSKDRSILMRLFHHKHMVETIERFEWKNLPPELNTDLIERVLYFRFKGALFNFNDRFFFLPFTLKGTIDSYGRYESITPVLFTGQWKSAGDGNFSKDIAFVTNLSYNVIYDMQQAQENGNQLEQGMKVEMEHTTDPEEAKKIAMDHLKEMPDYYTKLSKMESGQENEKKFSENKKNKAVILTDSTLEIAQDYTPMAYLIRPIVEQMVDILVLVNIDLITSAKHFYIVAKDADQQESIEKEFANLDNRILNGMRYTVVTSATELKELIGSSPKDTARYFQSFQSIDNLRKDLIGCENGGTFMKQEHTTQMETQTNTNSSSFVLNNALRMRKDFCSIVNQVFGLNIQVDVKNASEGEIVSPEGAQTKEDQEEGEQ